MAMVRWITAQKKHQRSVGKKTTFWGIVPTNSSKQHQSDIDTVPKQSKNQKTAPKARSEQQEKQRKS
jgi:tRNA A37 threonylcarbamoyltransferase TsaD